MNPPEEPPEEQCDICSILQFKAKASHVCVHCQKLLCNGCTRTHNTDQLFTNHTVLSIKNADGVTLHCVRHPMENVHLYCVTCAKAICVVCALSVHNDHDKQDFRQYVLSQRDTMQQLIQDAEIKEHEGISIIDQIDNNISQADSNLESLTEEMANHYEMIKQAVDEQHQALINELTQMTRDKQDALTQTKEMVKDRMQNLTDHTAMAKDLTSNEIKMVKLTNKFRTNFEQCLEVLSEGTEQALTPKVIRFMPSYDINLGTVIDIQSDSLAEDFDNYDDMGLRKLSLSSDDSSSLGFYDGSGYLSAGINSEFVSPRTGVGAHYFHPQPGTFEEYDIPRKRSDSFNFSLDELSSIVTTDDDFTPRESPEKEFVITDGKLTPRASPDKELLSQKEKTSQQGVPEIQEEPTTIVSKEIQISDNFKPAHLVAKIRLNRNFRRIAAGEPRLLYIVDYKNVQSVDPTGFDKYRAVPIGLAFKNEHKLLVTQWGVLPRTQHKGVPRYYPAKVGMVLYSLCNAHPCAEQYYTGCSPWSVAVHRGLFYVTDNRTTVRTIHKYMHTGKLYSSWPNHSFTEPRGLALSGDKIVVTDISHRQIRVCKEYKPNKASTVLKIGKPGRYCRARSSADLKKSSDKGEHDEQEMFVDPMFVTTNSLGWIIVSDAGDNSVKIFSPKGDNLYKIKRFSSNDHLNGPLGVITDASDNIYVADYGSDRIIKFNQTGDYLGVVLSSSLGGIYNPRDIAMYSSLLAVSCHEANGIPVVKVFEMGKQLRQPKEVKCPCNWLRLCDDRYTQ